MAVALTIVYNICIKAVFCNFIKMTGKVAQSCLKRNLDTQNVVSKITNMSPFLIFMGSRMPTECLAFFMCVPVVKIYTVY